MATYLSNLTGPSQIFTPRPKQLHERRANNKPSIALAFSNKGAEASEEPGTAIPFRNSRRASIGLVAATLVHQLAVGASRAEEENNGLWLTGPLPVPTVTNKIANKETGTRSFLRNGIYMANIGTHGSAYRLRQFAFDLLALEDLLGKDASSLVRKYLCLKSTVMYYDFDKLISAAPVEQQLPLTVLANRLFDSVEKLEDAVKQQSQSDPMIQSCYDETAVILKEVMSEAMKIQQSTKRQGRDCPNDIDLQC